MTTFGARALGAHMAHAAAALTATLLTLLLPAVAFAQEGDAFTAALEKGPAFAGGAAFLGGLLVSLTPCVYPMIAITVSVFGAKQAKSKREAMLLSTSFVGGMVVLFTTMLVVVALTGGVFGTVLQNKWVVVGIACIFVAMAASMFGAFEMTLPDSIMNRLSTVGGAGYGGAFMLGLVSGIVAAPCTGPVLTGIILWIGKTQNVLLGSIVGLSFALGLGLPFWFVGTFAASLPKGGRWMNWVKSFFGIVMLVVALYFLKNAFPWMTSFVHNNSTYLIVAAVVAVVGLAIGAVHVNWDDGGIVPKLRKGLGIAAVVGGGYVFVAALDKPKEVSAEEIAKALADEAAKSGTDKPLKPLTWIKDEAEAVLAARNEKRPLLIDFGAEWCGACKELERNTFSDAQVQAKGGRFVAVKVDATDDEDPKIVALMKKYEVKGLPTVILVDSEGKEQKRFVDYVAPKEFAIALEAVN